MYQERPKHNLYDQKINPLTSPFVSAADHQARYIFACDQLATVPKLETVADLGCGVGCSSNFMREQFVKRGFNPQLIGLEINSDSVNEAIRSYPDSITFCQADLSDPHLPSKVSELTGASLDGIAFLEVLEHIFPLEKLDTVLGNIKKLLTPDTGRVIISSPNRFLGSNIRNYPYNPFHTQELNCTEFMETVENSGLEIIALYGQRFIPNEYAQKLAILRTLSLRSPQIRKIIGKVMGLAVMLKNPDPNVEPFCKNIDKSPKYIVAVCR